MDSKRYKGLEGELIAALDRVMRGRVAQATADAGLGWLADRMENLPTMTRENASQARTLLFDALEAVECMWLYALRAHDQDLELKYAEINRVLINVNAAWIR